ncbi:MAG: hypothetical protein HY816_07240 [Candidatus Wallbacteria bacterium]|nr:hypothetical protein [Candidatus Wallbacteria bacterium]
MSTLKSDRSDAAGSKTGPLINIKEKRPPTEDAALTVKMAGSIEPGDVRVFVPIEVFEELERRVMKHPEQEWSGLLLGDLYRSAAFDYLEVEGFLPLRDSAARFTQETWEALYSELVRRKSDTNIIGWFFSDPQGNLAIEGYRQFVQESFFDDPYQISLGIDPHSGRYRFFEWKEGEIAALPGQYLFAAVARADDVKRLAQRPLADVRPTLQGPGLRIQSRRPQQGSIWKGLILFFVTLLSIGNLYWLIVLVERVTEASEKATAVETRQNALKVSLDRAELAAKGAAQLLAKRPSGIDYGRYNDLERRLTDLQRNYTRLKIQLDRSLASKEGPKDKEKGKQGKDKKDGKPGAQPPVEPARPVPQPAALPADATPDTPEKPADVAPTPAAAPPETDPNLPPTIAAPVEPEQPPIGPPRPPGPENQPAIDLPGTEPAAEPLPPGSEPAPDGPYQPAAETPVTTP